MMVYYDATAKKSVQEVSLKCYPSVHPTPQRAARQERRLNSEHYNAVPLRHRLWQVHADWCRKQTIVTCLCDNKLLLAIGYRRFQQFVCNKLLTYQTRLISSR